MVDILTGPDGHSVTRHAVTARNTEHATVPIPRRLTVGMIARGLGTTEKCLTVMMDRAKVRNVFYATTTQSPSFLNGVTQVVH